ncbi:MAG: hypothetical protein JEZ00_09500 [Anaerolineaceae bacterium]|nr:hypothetical protein [Anaerolineaceae bacterium]
MAPFLTDLRKRKEWIIIGMIVFISAVAYLPFIHHFGYYLDDWNLIWAGVTNGPQKLIQLYSIDRPFIGYVFAGMYSLLGEAAFGWNIAAFIFRLAGVFSFWWLVRMLWPKQKHHTMVMALLFAAYPGFLRQPNAIQYLMHIINFTFGVFSLAASVAVFQCSKRWTKIVLSAVAILCGLSSFLMMEYMVGLEGIRLAIFWILANRGNAIVWWKNWKQPLIHYIPYGLMTFVFLFWRLFIFKSTRFATDVGMLMGQYVSDPIYKLLSIASNLFKDFFEVIVGGWTVVPYQYISAMRLKDFLTTILLVFFVGIGILFVFLTTHESPLQTEPKKENWSLEAIWLGVIAVLITMLPVILSNRSVAFYNTFDRYSLPGTIGMAIFIVGVLVRWAKPALHLWMPLIMLCTAVFTHIANGYVYQNNWEAQRDFWWQTYWRIPGLQDDTVLMASIGSTGASMEEDYEIWGPANLIYHPDEKEIRILAEVLNVNTLQNMQMGRGDERFMRTITFDRDYEKSLVLSIPSTSSCMHVMDNRISPVSTSENPLVAIAGDYSKSELIDLNPVKTAGMTASIFGEEPWKSWCYYYQKASLAEQTEDWEIVVNLGDEAQALGERADDWSEWLPFLHGYLFTENFDQANGLIPIIKSDVYLTSQVCNLTEDALANAQDDVKIAGYEYLLTNLCGYTAE